MSLLALSAVSVLAAAGSAIETRVVATLPQPVANNAVALVQTEEGTALFSFLGLGAAKTWRDTLSVAYRIDLPEGRVQALTEVPGTDGRLAGAAVSVAGLVFVFGGYTVAEDGSEKSIETVHALDPETGEYTRHAPMPVPVDDSVALAYQDRYIYLVSGWHDSGNVNLVQVLDTQAGKWFQATPYPGSPVFGHAGGIVGDTLVICDGVRVVVSRSAKRGFEATNECYLGRIEAEDASRIDWRALPAHPGKPLYRMAATGSASRAEILFAGGSDNPYNFDGIGYDGNPSAPSATVFAYSLAADAWRTLGTLDIATMDHRGLLEGREAFYLIGGMRANQQPSAEIRAFGVRTKVIHR